LERSEGKFEEGYEDRGEKRRRGAITGGAKVKKLHKLSLSQKGTIRAAGEFKENERAEGGMQRT